MRANPERSGKRLALLPWQRAHTDQGRIAILLAELEPAGFRILHAVGTGFGDIDHVVIGPSGVFSVQIAYWAGTVHSKRGRLLSGAHDEDRTRRRAEWNATCLEQWLDEDGVDVPVAAVLVPAEARVEGDRIDLPYLTVLPPTSLKVFLQDAPATLTAARVQRAAASIEARAVATGKRATRDVIAP
jgi:hypothetical protein